MTPVPWPEVEPLRVHKLIYKQGRFGEDADTIRGTEPFKRPPDTLTFHKFLEDDRYGLDSKELRFVARMLTDDSFQKPRIFVIRFSMVDDTLSITPIAQDNSGLVERPFLMRKRVTKSRPENENSGPYYYGPHDMYVGNIVRALGKPFRLVEADQYTYDYMEKNCEKFYHSDIRRITTECRAWLAEKCGILLKKFESRDPQSTGEVSYQHFRNIMYEEMPSSMLGGFPEQAMKTFARYYAADDYDGLRIQDLIRILQTELHRKGFYDFKNVKLAFEVQDKNREGFMDADRVYYVLRTISLPVNRDLLKSFAYKFPKHGNRIRYADLVKNLDWMSNPVKPNKEKNSQLQINWERAETVKNLDKIMYRCLLKDMCLS